MLQNGGSQTIISDIKDISEVVHELIQERSWLRNPLIQPLKSTMLIISEPFHILNTYLITRV
jgi:hypothetical protein